jgi:putative glutamine amidotransferase
VLVTPSVDAHPDGERFRINTAYLNALESADLTPLIAQPSRDPGHMAAMLERASGLVLTGGDDLDPRLYGEEPHPATEKPSDLRDEWELKLVEAARQRGLPTLAICRGMQLVNVALGGTLIQDIAQQRQGALVHERSAARGVRVHAVEVDGDSRLAELLGTRRLNVNSMHHQGVARVSDLLRATSRAPDAIVESLEWPGEDWWMVAVQWHPEELVDDAEPWDRRLFRGFSDRVLRVSDTGV